MRHNLALSFIVCSLALLGFSQGGRAGTNLTTTVSQGSGLNWSSTGGSAAWVTNSAGTYINTTPKVGPPVAGNTYECIDRGVPLGFNTGNTRLRNPTTAAPQTFPGDSLTLYTNTEIRFKQGSSVAQTQNFPGPGGGSPGLILNGGLLDDGDNGTVNGNSFVLLGQIQAAAGSLSCLAAGGNLGITPDGTVANPYVSWPRSFIVGGQLSGSGTLAVILTASHYRSGTNPPTIPSPVLVTNSLNSFSGNWIVQEGWLQGTAPGSLGSGNITVDPYAVIPSLPALTLETPANSTGGTNYTVEAILDFAYAVVSPGTVTLTNGGKMNLHTNCILAGLTVEGTSLPLGTYTYAQLTGAPYNFTNFVPGGSGSIQIATPVPPPAPAGLAAATGDTQETLSWSPANTATGYIISRSAISGGTYSPIGSTSGLGFVDSGLTDGQLYYYVVVATNAFGSSARSAEVAGRPSLPVTGLAVVTNSTELDLSWSSFSGATSYTVLRGTRSGGPYTAIATGLTGTTYTNTPVQSGSLYYYVVVGALSGGFSTAPSAEAGALTYPAVPSLAAPLYGTNGIEVVLSTTDAVLPQYAIEVSSNGAPFTPLTTLTAGNNSLFGRTVSTYVLANLEPGSNYLFRATAQNDAGISGYSVVAGNTVPTNAVCVSFSTDSSVVPPGYLHGSTTLFGDQGNGFTYGWDQDLLGNALFRIGTTIDLRWEGFIMQQKNLGVPYPVWTITNLANGLYTVHLVSGDPLAIDSTLQENVNGVDTTIVHPSGLGLGGFAEWTVLCLVTNNAVTLSTTTNAVNDKINFIDLYPAAPPAASFTLGPVSGTAPLTVTFTNTSTGYSSALWTFGDGGVSTSTNAVVAYTYTVAPATNTVSLTVSNSVGMYATSTLPHAVAVTESAPVTLVMARSGSNLRFTWSQGQLLEATNLAGPWMTNFAAASPFMVSPTNAQMFFRVRVR